MIKDLFPNSISKQIRFKQLLEQVLQEGKSSDPADIKYIYPRQSQGTQCKCYLIEDIMFAQQIAAVVVNKTNIFSYFKIKCKKYIL